MAAAARAVARASSTEITQAACSWATRAGDWDRSIGPVDGPAPVIADLASFSVVSEPTHRQWYACGQLAPGGPGGRAGR